MNLSKVIYINYENYSTLLDGGTITKDGQSYTFDSSALYIIREMPIEHATTATYAERAGLASSADSAINDANGNSITGTYGKKPLIIEVNESDSGTTLKQGTYDSITQALNLSKLVIMKVTLDEHDNDIIYLPLVNDLSEANGNTYEFGKLDRLTNYYAVIDTANYFYLSNFEISQSSSVVHILGTETITGDKTFTGTVSLGSKATATTPATTDNDTSVATTAFVHNVVNAIPSTEQVQADWSLDSTTANDYIKNKPNAITNSEIDVIWNEAFGNLITFTINNVSYQAVEGMTWGQWVDSSYNTNGWIVVSNYISDSTHTGYISNVNFQDVIIANKKYVTIGSGGLSD